MRVLTVFPIPQSVFDFLDDLLVFGAVDATPLLWTRNRNGRRVRAVDILLPDYIATKRMQRYHLFARSWLWHCVV